MVSQLDDEGAAARIAEWLNANTEVSLDPAAARLDRLTGGNSNVTYRLREGEQSCLIRRPPLHGLDASAHSMARESTLLTALQPTDVPTPELLGYCQDATVLGAEFLVMQYFPDSVSLTDRLPEAYAGDPDAVRELGYGLVDALSALQGVDWRASGLAEFGRPEGYLDRQVPRWSTQYRRHQVRELPDFDRVADWLSANIPVNQPPAVIHGDFHLDNCLFSVQAPRLLAVIDWEMASIGDPLVDLGLTLALWGPRPVDPPGMVAIQAVSRGAGTPSRDELIERYASQTGRDLSGIRWYQVFGLWKLASIVESAWAQHTRGELASEYSAALEYNVPTLFAEAAFTAGLAEPSTTTG